MGSTLLSANWQLVLIIMTFDLSSPQAFNEFLLKDGKTQEKIANLKQRVEEFAEKYPIPGFDDH